MKDRYLQREVASGERIEFEGVINTEYAPGDIQRYLTVQCSDGKEYRVELRFVVEETWGMDAERLEFNENTPDSQTVKLRPDCGATILSASADKPWFDVQFESSAIHVSIEWEVVPPGLQAAVLNIYSDDTNVPGLHIPIKVNSTRSMYIYPSVVYLYDSNPRVVELRGTESVQIVGMQALPDSVESKIDGRFITLTQKKIGQRREITVYADLSNGEQVGFTLYY